MARYEYAFRLTEDGGPGQELIFLKNLWVCFQFHNKISRQAEYSLQAP